MHGGHPTPYSLDQRGYRLWQCRGESSLKWSLDLLYLLLCDPNMVALVHNHMSMGIGVALRRLTAVLVLPLPRPSQYRFTAKYGTGTLDKSVPFAIIELIKFCIRICWKSIIVNRSTFCSLLNMNSPSHVKDGVFVIVIAPKKYLSTHNPLDFPYLSARINPKPNIISTPKAQHYDEIPESLNHFLKPSKPAR
jgi:hypothetical protein